MAEPLVSSNEAEAAPLQPADVQRVASVHVVEEERVLLVERREPTPALSEETSLVVLQVVAGEQPDRAHLLRDRDDTEHRDRRIVVVRDGEWIVRVEVASGQSVQRGSPTVRPDLPRI